MRQFLTAFIAATALLVAPISAQEQCVQEQCAHIEAMLQMKQANVAQGTIIYSITFQGNSAIQTSTLQQQLKINPNTEYSFHGFTKAVRRVQIYYMNNNFPQAKATYQVFPSAVDGQIAIVITIQEGA